MMLLHPYISAFVQRCQHNNKQAKGTGWNWQVQCLLYPRSELCVWLLKLKVPHKFQWRGWSSGILFIFSGSTQGLKKDVCLGCLCGFNSSASILKLNCTSVGRVVLDILSVRERMVLGILSVTFFPNPGELDKLRAMQKCLVSHCSNSWHNQAYRTNVHQAQYDLPAMYYRIQ